MHEFKENQLVIYCPMKSEYYDEGDLIDRYVYKAEIGRFKRYSNNRDTAFVYFTCGDTAAACNVSDLVPLDNYWYIMTNLGGIVTDGNKECVMINKRGITGWDYDLPNNELNLKIKMTPTEVRDMMERIKK